MSMISTAASGLSATQVVLNAISNNVANSETDGYSRRTVTLSSVSTGGVTASSVDRVTSFYLQQQTWSSTSDVGYYTSYSEYSSYLEEIMSSDSLDISTLLGTLNTALQSASASPDDESLRTAVLTAAQSVADAFNMLDGYLDDIGSEVDSQISSTVTQVNDLTSQIAELNDKIVTLKSQGQDTSSLEDSRDSAISSLSELVEVTVTAQDDGSYTLTLPQGQTLVNGSASGLLSYDTDETTGTSTLNLTYGKQKTSVSTDMSGSLGGLFAFSSEVLAKAQTKLDALAQDVSSQFNDAQTSGYYYDEDGNAVAGTALFTDVSSSTNAAASIAIADDFTYDMLAFSDSSTAGSTGNNGNLTNMVTLSSSLQSSYTSLVTELGQISSQASSSLTSTTSLQSTLQDSVDSVSGVNLDEEAANLVLYQNVYSANSKVLTVADELFDSILNMF